MAARLIRWSYVLAAAAMYGALAYGAWYWGGVLFPR